MLGSQRKPMSCLWAQQQSYPEKEGKSALCHVSVAEFWGCVNFGMAVPHSRRWISKCIQFVFRVFSGLFWKQPFILTADLSKETNAIWLHVEFHSPHPWGQPFSHVKLFFSPISIWIVSRVTLWTQVFWHFPARSQRGFSLLDLGEQSPQAFLHSQYFLRPTFICIMGRHTSAMIAWCFYLFSVVTGCGESYFARNIHWLLPGLVVGLKSPSDESIWDGFSQLIAQLLTNYVPSMYLIVLLQILQCYDNQGSLAIHSQYTE